MAPTAAELLLDGLRWEITHRSADCSILAVVRANHEVDRTGVDSGEI